MHFRSPRFISKVTLISKASDLILLKFHSLNEGSSGSSGRCRFFSVWRDIFACKWVPINLDLNSSYQYSTWTSKLLAPPGRTAYWPFLVQWNKFQKLFSSRIDCDLQNKCLGLILLQKRCFCWFSAGWHLLPMRSPKTQFSLPKQKFKSLSL